jgi:hypothetical protein
MSASQMLAVSSLDLSVPAACSSLSMAARMSLVCSATAAPRALRDLPGGVHGVAVDHALAHARPDLEALDGHGWFPLARATLRADAGLVQDRARATIETQPRCRSRGGVREA